MVDMIDRAGMKAEMGALLRDAEVSPKKFVALYLLLTAALGYIDALTGSMTAGAYNSPLGLFVSILTFLLLAVLEVGIFLYCLKVRRRERAEYSTLFDGFSFAGRVIGLAVLQCLFVFLWSLLLVIPGIVASYRYRFAYLNLCENPEIGCMDALELSKQQTNGHKLDLLALDISYFGWGLLSAFPTLVYELIYYFQSMDTVYQAITSGLTDLDALVFAGPSAVALLVCFLWSAVVSIFYLPTYYCVLTGYYEIAKCASGATPLFEQGGTPGINAPFGDYVYTSSDDDQSVQEGSSEHGSGRDENRQDGAGGYDESGQDGDGQDGDGHSL